MFLDTVSIPDYKFYRERVCVVIYFLLRIRDEKYDSKNNSIIASEFALTSKKQIPGPTFPHLQLTSPQL
jgi:hypothetical protein